MARRRKPVKNSLQGVFDQINNNVFSDGSGNTKRPVTDPLDMLCMPWTCVEAKRPVKGNSAHAVISWPDGTESIIDHKHLLKFLPKDKDWLDTLKAQAVDYVLQTSTQPKITREGVEALIDKRFEEMRRTAGIVSQYALRHLQREQEALRADRVGQANAGGKLVNYRL